MKDGDNPPERTINSSEAFVRFVRLFSLGATLLYPLIGISTGKLPVPVGAVLWSLVAASLFHVFADVSNDVMDLPIDRTDPRRETSPLVQGTISQQRALFIAIVMIPAMLAVSGLFGLGVTIEAIVAAVVFIGLYNIAGKAIPIPIIADVGQGVGWAALVVAGAMAAGGVTDATMWSAIAVIVYISMVNGVHGAIRDSVNDRATGARTTALILGVGITADFRVILPLSIVAWGIALQTAFGVALTGFILADGQRIATAAVVASAALYLTTWIVAVRAYQARASLRRAMALGTWHLFLLPASLLAASFSRMPWWLAVTASVSFVLPPLVYRLVLRRSTFGVPSTSLPPQQAEPVGAGWRATIGALWSMTRPGTWAAAGALVGVGVSLAGEPTVRTLPLMAATAFAVAAANVFNDRCDHLADAVNGRDRPLVSGIVTDNDADKFVLAAALAATSIATIVSGEASLATSLLLVLGLAYSLVLRRVALVGQLAVATLFGVPVLYGAWLTGEAITIRHWIAFLLITLYLFGREVLKGVPDRKGDNAMGYRTPAVVFGEAGALKLFRLTMASFCIAALAAYAVVDDVTYLFAASLLAVAPTVRALVLIRGAPSRETVERTIEFSGVVFALGLIPLLLMS